MTRWCFRRRMARPRSDTCLRHARQGMAREACSQPAGRTDVLVVVVPLHHRPRPPLPPLAGVEPPKPAVRALSQLRVRPLLHLSPLVALRRCGNQERRHPNLLNGDGGSRVRDSRRTQRRGLVAGPAAGGHVGRRDAALGVSGQEYRRVAAGGRGGRRADAATGAHPRSRRRRTLRAVQRRWQVHCGSTAGRVGAPPPSSRGRTHRVVLLVVAVLLLVVVLIVVLIVVVLLSTPHPAPS